MQPPIWDIFTFLKISHINLGVGQKYLKISQKQKRFVGAVTDQMQKLETKVYFTSLRVLMQKMYSWYWCHLNTE